MIPPATTSNAHPVTATVTSTVSGIRSHATATTPLVDDLNSVGQRQSIASLTEHQDFLPRATDVQAQPSLRLHREPQVSNFLRSCSRSPTASLDRPEVSEKPNAQSDKMTVAAVYSNDQEFYSESELLPRWLGALDDAQSEWNSHVMTMLTESEAGNVLVGRQPADPLVVEYQRKITAEIVGKLHILPAGYREKALEYIFHDASGAGKYVLSRTTLAQILDQFPEEERKMQRLIGFSGLGLLALE